MTPPHPYNETLDRAVKKYVTRKLYKIIYANANKEVYFLKRAVLLPPPCAPYYFFTDNITPAKVFTEHFAIKNAAKFAQTVLFLIFLAAHGRIPAAAADTLPADADTAHTVGSPDTTYGIPAIFSLHEKRSVKSIDTLIAPSLRELALSAQTQKEDYGGLNVSGYKSFGVSVGELGEINLEQGLEVTIEGEIRPGTTLGAYLSDQGSTIDGSTREISDFDMMNVSLTNKNFSVTAGDRYALWPEGGILSGQKKIVGISAAVTPEKTGAAVNAFGSFSGGNHTVQTVRGREGVQGPYYLTGKGEAGIITPVDGTVKVRANGRDLTEGRDEDFTVDYDIGAVTFNPRVLIRQEDLIRIEYEYKAFDYRRTFIGGGASYHTADTVFSIRGNLWSESDDMNNPIEMELSETEKEILRSGKNGSAYTAPTARPVNPLDVAKMSVYYPLYKKKYDDNAGDTILIYTPYDPLRPDDVRDFYTAGFTPAQTGTAGADYVIDSTVQRGQFVYKYAGKGLGGHTALAPIAAPARETAGEIEARLKLRRVSAALNVAGKENDKNLFSTLDNDDNLSSAVMFKLNAGEKTLDRRTLWADFDYRYRSRNFSDEIFSANERKELWDETSADNGDGIADISRGSEFQSLETMVGVTIVKGAEISAGAGQTFIDSLKETEKVTGDVRTLFMRDKMGFDVGGALFKHYLSDKDVSYRRQARLSFRPSTAWESFIHYGDEWRADTAGYGGGHVSGTAEAAYLPVNLRQNVNLTQYRRGDGFFESADSGYALTWNQSAAFNPHSLWRLTGDSKWRSVKINGSPRQNTAPTSTSTFLMTAVSEIEPTSQGFSSRQEYRVNQELASRFEQKMFYIGKGLGTHAFDSAAGEFRPSANGDHIIQEVEIYDNVSSTTVRKTTLSGDWYFRPRKKIRGILNDLSWSGILSAEEHIDARNHKAVSYIPGYLSLYPPDESADTSANAVSSTPTYTDISYRQDIDYIVSGSIYKSRLYLLPSLRVVRGYREPAFETAVKTERKKGRLLLSAEPKYLSVKREPQHSASDNLSSELNLRDVSAEIVQSVEFWNTFEFYIRERGGKIFNNSHNRELSVPFDSSAYFQIKPGIAHRPIAGGIAEISYTFSYVPYNGELDYRMAGGQRAGTSHIITIFSDINAGKHFNLSALYRGEQSRAIGEEKFAPMTHVFSLQVKAFL